MKKPLLKYLHYCERAFLSDKGKLSIIEEFDILEVKEIPVAQLRMSIVFRVENMGNEDGNIKLKSPSGETLLNANFSRSQEGKENFVFLLDLVMIQFNEEGKHCLEVKVGEISLINSPDLFALEIKKV